MAGFATDSLSPEQQQALAYYSNGGSNVAVPASQITGTVPNYTPPAYGTPNNVPQYSASNEGNTPPVYPSNVSIKPDGTNTFLAPPLSPAKAEESATGEKEAYNQADRKAVEALTPSPMQQFGTGASDRANAQASSAPTGQPVSAASPASPNRFQTAIADTKKSAEDENASLRQQIAIGNQGLKDAQDKASYTAGAINKTIDDQINVWDPYKKAKGDWAQKLSDDRFNAIKKEIANVPDVDIKKAYTGGTFGQIGAAIAQGLGAFGAGMAHTQNFASNIINSAVEQNVSAQKDNIAKQWKKVSTDTDFAKDEFAQNMFHLQKEDDMRMAHYHLANEQIANMATSRYGQDPMAQANAKSLLEANNQKIAEINQRTSDRVLAVQGQQASAQASAQAGANANNPISAKAYAQYLDKAQNQNTDHPDKPIPIASYADWAKARSGEGAPAPTAVAGAGGKVSPRIAVRIADGETALSQIDQLLSMGRTLPGTEASAKAGVLGSSVQKVASDIAGDKGDTSWLENPTAIWSPRNMQRLEQLKETIKDHNENLRNAGKNSAQETEESK